MMYIRISFTYLTSLCKFFTLALTCGFSKNLKGKDYFSAFQDPTKYRRWFEQGCSLDDIETFFDHHFPSLFQMFSGNVQRASVLGITIILIFYDSKD